MNKKMVMGLFIAFIMIASIFGVVFDRFVAPSQSYEYGDFKFRVYNNQYIANINGKQHTFSFFPRDLEAIQVSDDVKALLDQPVLTVAYDPNSDMAEAFGEAQYYFEVQLDGKSIERALTDNTNFTSIPKKSCADATSSQPVIELRKSNESGIVADKNCLIINSLDQYDLYQQTERTIYTALGVM